MKQFSGLRENTSEHNKEGDVKVNEAIRSLLNGSNDYLRQTLGKSFPNIPIIDENLTQELDKLEQTILNKIEEDKTEEVVETYENHTTESDDILNESVDPLLDYYKLYRDREETFECNISVSGASLSTTQVRLIFDTTSINVVFYGKLYKDGRCIVPLQKMTMFPEGTRGQLRLEVIVDDTLFVPWESSCIVEGAKKVTVDIKQKKAVSINFEDSTQ